MSAKESKKTCPITATAELLSDTWTMLIMRALTEGPKRFTELEKWLEDISSRTLTLKLQKLSKQGMVKRTPNGLYMATEKGKGLKVIERAMVAYGKRYLER
jgi:DNA-binding HxlR family transcriptional regulator